MTALARLTLNLPRVSPAEIVEFPKRIAGENQVPDWKREEVYKHPKDIRPSVCGEDDKDCWETENETEKDERNIRDRLSDESNDNWIHGWLAKLQNCMVGKVGDILK